LAVTSYNHGIGNIRKAIRAAGSRDLATIIARYHRGDFQFASSNFYTCFLAALHAEKYHDVLFPNIPRERLLERKVYTLTSHVSLNTLKKTLKLTTQDILDYNQDLVGAKKRNIVLKKGFVLHLPPGHQESLLHKIGISAKEKKSDRRASQDSKKKKSA
jgi:membrane-bound lytic murein transglycosylase D